MKSDALFSRQKEFTGYLMKGFPELGLKGLPLISACAVTGNGSVENQAKPVTTGRKDHGSDGILQWRLGRLDGPKGLRGMAQKWGMPWDTLETQAAFTLWELYTDKQYVRLANDLLEGRKKIETLTANFCWIYERPNRELAGLDLRIRHAKSVYKLMGQAPTSSSSSLAGATAVGGVVVASAARADFTSSASIILFALLLAASIWVMGTPTQEDDFEEELEVPEDFPEVLAPLEISSSETAEYDAAKANRIALEKELAEAKVLEEAARIRVQERVQSLLSVISEPQVQIAPKKESENERIGKDGANKLADVSAGRRPVGSGSAGVS